MGRRRLDLADTELGSHTHTLLLVQMILKASNTSSRSKTSVPSFSIIPQGNSFCKRLWLSLKLSLILYYKKGTLCGWNFADFSPPSSPRCFWFSGCTPVREGHLGERLELYLQQRRMWISHAKIQDDHFVLRDQLQNIIEQNRVNMKENIKTKIISSLYNFECLHWLSKTL